MNARTYPRTAVQAFPRTTEYACAIECYRPSFLASRAVWIGGALSVAIWLLLGLVVM